MLADVGFHPAPLPQVRSGHPMLGIRSAAEANLPSIARGDCDRIYGAVTMGLRMATTKRQGLASISRCLRSADQMLVIAGASMAEQGMPALDVLD
jgi:hypothetical protein